LSSAARTGETFTKANATTTRDNNLIAFIFFWNFSRSKDRPLGVGYFFSSLSFLGWHFSQTLPSLAALTQHLWSHFFPASTVASQQAARMLLEQKASANPANTSDFTNFMFSFPDWPTVGQHSVFLNSPPGQGDSAFAGVDFNYRGL